EVAGGGAGPRGRGRPGVRGRAPLVAPVGGAVYRVAAAGHRRVILSLNTPGWPAGGPGRARRWRRGAGAWRVPRRPGAPSRPPDPPRTARPPQRRPPAAAVLPAPGPD